MVPQSSNPCRCPSFLRAHIQICHCHLLVSLSLSLSLISSVPVFLPSTPYSPKLYRDAGQDQTKTKTGSFCFLVPHWLASDFGTNKEHDTIFRVPRRHRTVFVGVVVREGCKIFEVCLNLFGFVANTAPGEFPPQKEHPSTGQEGEKQTNKRNTVHCIP